MKNGNGSEKVTDRPPRPSNDILKNEREKRATRRPDRAHSRGVQTAMPVTVAASDRPLDRFIRSMIIDYEKWHDGIGYDLEALEQASPDERSAIENVLVSSKGRDWRDIEALAELDTPRSRREIRDAFGTADIQVQLAVISYAPDIVNDGEKVEVIVKSLREGKILGGLSHALDLVEEFHPPEVVEELFRGVQEREGEVAVNFAAMLLFIHGKAQDPFDWSKRPFLLRFNTKDPKERSEVFLELCQMMEVNAQDHMVKMK
jgi:hypothetical protein